MTEMQKTKNDLAISQLKVCIDRVDAEYEETHWAWAHFWGMNGYSEEERRHYINGVNGLQLGAGSNALKQIFAKETILGIFRLTDVGDDVQNFTTVAEKLRNEELAKELIRQSEQWPTANPTEECSRLIDNYKKMIPYKWKNHCLKNNVLIEFREKYRDLRNAKLAHILLDDDISSPNETEIWEVLNFLGHRLEEVHAFVLGESISFEWENKDRSDICTKLWDTFQNGVRFTAEKSYPGFASDKDQTR